MANDIKWGRRGKPKIDSSTNNYPVRFATQPGYRKGERFVELRMQTFKNIDGYLKSQPVEEWHTLARIYKDRIDTWPVNSDATSEFYLTPTHKTINCIRYRPPKPFPSVPPREPEDAISFIEWVFDPRFFHLCNHGLGLKNKFIAPLSMLNLPKSIKTLELVFEGSTFQNKRIFRLSESVLAKLADDYSNSFDHRLRNINKPKRNLTLASQLQVVSKTRATDYPASSDLREELVLNSLRSSYLDEVLLPVLTSSPEQAWRLWSHVKRAILNNMISEYEVMLASQEDASSWKTFISRHTELIHEVLKDPFCGICKSSRKRDTNSSDEGIIIASESALVLIIKSPDTPLVTKISRGAATTSWVASAQIQSAVNETLEFSRTFNGGKTRYVVIAGTLPKNKAPLTALEGYKRTVSQIQIVDFTALLEGLRRLTSKTGKPA